VPVEDLETAGGPIKRPRRTRGQGRPIRGQTIDVDG